jgi:Flp pilus assembly protein TadD
MRSAELIRLAGLVAALGLAGCGGLSRSGSGSASNDAAVVAPLRAPSGPPVDAGAQRAFDDARRLLAAGRLDEAERGLRTLAQAHPTLGGVHANLGLIHLQAGKTADAVADLEQAVKLSPWQPVFHNQLGIAYRQNGQFAKAREAYQKALTLDPAYTAPTLNLAILHDLYLADNARAIELYERYLALSQNADPQVAKWVVDLKNRKPGSPARKEQP